MTPTEQDKESDKDIEKELQAILDYEGDTVRHNTFDNIVSLVLQYAERVALEARIDELTKLRRMFERLAEYADDKEWVMSQYDDHIAELKAQQEELK